MYEFRADTTPLETPNKRCETSELAGCKRSSSTPSATGRDRASSAARIAAERLSRDTIRGHYLVEAKEVSQYFSPNLKSMPIITQRSPLASSSTRHTPLTPRKSPSSSSPSRRKRFLSPSPCDQPKRRKVDKDFTPQAESCPSALAGSSSSPTTPTPFTPRRRAKRPTVSPSPSKKSRVRHKPPSPFDALESKYFVKNYAFNPLMVMEEHDRDDLMQRLRAAKPDMIQETFAADPWKVLIATIFLNVTHGTQSIPIVHALLEIWNTPEKMAEASPDEIYPCIRHLGLGHSRSKRIVDLSRAWISRPLSFDDKSVLSKSNDRAKEESSELGNRDRAMNESSPVKGNKNCLFTRISHLPGVGRYALDSFRTFCTTSNEWKTVRPTDKELIRFLAWKWAYHEHRRWHPERGPMGYAEAAYIECLIANLAVTTPGGCKSSQ